MTGCAGEHAGNWHSPCTVLLVLRDPACCFAEPVCSRFKVPDQGALLLCSTLHKTLVLNSCKRTSTTVTVRLPAELTVQLHLWCFQVDIAHPVTPVVPRQLGKVHFAPWHLQQQKQAQQAHKAQTQPAVHSGSHQISCKYRPAAGSGHVFHDGP